MQLLPTTFTCLMVLLSLPALYAQSDVPEKKIVPVSFRAGYLGSLLYPGFALAAEVPLQQREVFHNNKDGLPSLRRIKQQHLTARFTFYHHPQYHDHLLLSFGYQWRRTSQSGWFLDVNPQVGVSRTFIATTVYRVTSGNKIEKVQMAGDWFLHSQVAFSIGRRINHKDALSPVSIYLRPSLMALFPYNHFLYVRPTVEIGALFTLPNGPGIQTNVRSKYKQH